MDDERVAANGVSRQKSRKTKEFLRGPKGALPDEIHRYAQYRQQKRHPFLHLQTRTLTLPVKHTSGDPSWKFAPLWPLGPENRLKSPL
ncbi:hypothetical protein ACSSV1_002323 [Labrenzia sp. MBR-25]